MDASKLDPVKHMDVDMYVRVWQYMFEHILSGFWARFLAAAFLGLSFWFGVRRRNFQLGIAFFIVTLFFTFGSPLLKISGLM